MASTPTKHKKSPKKSPKSHKKSPKRLSKESPKRNKVVWSDAAKSRGLVVLLLKATRQGERSDNGFKTKTWREIAAAYNAQWTPKLTRQQLQTHAQTVSSRVNFSITLKLSNRYKIFHAIVECSGFGWDEERQLPTAPDHVWEDYIEVYPFQFTSNKLETLKSGRIPLQNFALLCRVAWDIW